MGVSESRRDDLEALGYLFFYFMEGKLPWECFYWFEDEDILSKKKKIATEKLCKDCPIEFSMYLNYCKGLRFEEDPDYDYLRRLFRNLAKKKKIEYDWIFDWSQ